MAKPAGCYSSRLFRVGQVLIRSLLTESLQTVTGGSYGEAGGDREEALSIIFLV